VFTGIVEETGRVRAVVVEGDSTSIHIGANRTLDGLRLGDSIAVDGTCLTATRLEPDGFWVGISPETRQRTNLGERVAGDVVNLERAVQIGARLDGHYVQGHVDGVGTIVEKQADGDSLRVWFRAPANLLRYIVVKGFVAVDGVSLTVTDRVDDRFGVALVAYTQGIVALPHKSIGQSVNLEVDVIAKYVESILESRVGRAQ
jgi:riboflavin synthase